MYEYEEQLFGMDMRHKPPMPQMLTAEGWGSSHGRLAYSGFNRQQAINYSEYAVRTMGCVPQGYVIVNAHDVKFNPDTALRVAHGRVAIPVKEYAKQRKLTLEEQWELMNPKWVGTFFGFCGEEPYRNRRPSLSQAIADAEQDGKLDSFLCQFWNAKIDHKDAIDRLWNRVFYLKSQADRLYDRYMSLKRKISTVESDIHYCRYEKYHLQGYNVHDYLQELKDDFSDVSYEREQLKQKANRIRDYIKSITF
jgi:hypothetical protein